MRHIGRRKAAYIWHDSTWQTSVRMLENAQQTTIMPITQSTIAPGTLIYTDDYAICDRLDGAIMRLLTKMRLPQRG